MKVTYIYSLNCPVSGEVKYIGKSNNPTSRLKTHIYESNSGRKTKKCFWIKSLLEKDLKPDVIILDIVEYDNWQFWECFYIELYKSWGFNLKNGTKGGEGGRQTFDVRKKMSLAKIGKTTSDKQKQISSEMMMCNKLSVGNTNHAKPVKCLNIETGEVIYYTSSLEASIKLGIGRTSVSNNVNGMSSIVAKKYVFEKC